VNPYYSGDGILLFHGDCREITEWLEADVLFTDPPYGMSYVSGWLPNAIEGDATADARDTALTLWGARPALIFGTWRVERPAATRALLVWDKGEWPGMGDLKLPWGPSHEEIYVIGDGFVGTREGTVVRTNRTPAARVDHPTPKPLSLMERLIAKCPPGVIADPFAGSGSTLLAARAQGRKAIGVEIEERYCALIAKRLDQGTLDFGGAA
jgi:site-specific DNA-methyltransferase (adenine-specific)